jgi:predicted RND superfamily exporter protein
VEGTLGKLAPKDMAKMAPIVIIIIITVLFVILRSFKATVLNMFVVLLSTIWTFGLMALFKVPVYSVSTMIPVMLIAIGVADGIHMFSHMDFYRRIHRDAEKKEVIENMLTHMWKPILMTSVTTAVGFISLLTSQVYPVKYFGLFTAFGVMTALFLSLVLIPSGLMLFGLPKLHKIKPHSVKENKFAAGFADFVAEKKALTIFTAAFVIAISLFGITKVWVNSSFLANFENNSDIVLTDKFINENFAGTSSFNVVLEGSENGTFKDPQTLKLVDDLQNDLEDLKLVGSTFSLADFIRRMNKVMNEDNEAFNSIPDSREMIAQYLLLYEMSGDPDNLTAVIDYDYQHLNLNTQLKSDGSKIINEAIDVVETYRSQFEEMGVKINFAGSGYRSLVFTELILKGQISSIILSIIIVILLVSLMFKNIIIGLISSVPIMITTFLSFGAMGLLNIALGSTTALISSIAIGIGIDYSIHFLEKYKSYALTTKDKKKTSQLTMYNTGRAILFNAIVVIAGFLALLFSAFPPNRQLGALVSLNMFSSLIGTVTIMYLLLYLSNIYFKKEKSVFTGERK